MQTNNNSVQTQQKNSVIPFRSYMEDPKVQALVQTTLQSVARTKKFTASLLSSYSLNPALAKCTSKTVLTSALLGESLGLSPSPQLGHYYIVPYANKNNPVMTDSKGNPLVDKKGYQIHQCDGQFQMGYKGYIQLALRSGQYEDIDVVEIREGEYKGKNKETGKPQFEFIDDDDIRENLPIIGYKATIVLKTGFKKTIYWSKAKMLNHANLYSAAFNKNDFERLQRNEISEKDMWKYSSFWYKNFDEMAFKTLLRNIISKWGIISIELSTAFERDMSVEDENGNPNYVDNPENKNKTVIDLQEEQINDVASKEMPDEEEPKKDTQDIANDILKNNDTPSSSTMNGWED